MVETLPRGRHNLGEELVRKHQRDRLIAAVAESIYARGYENTTVTHVSIRARVSKSDLYKSFASKHECFVAAYEDGLERLRRQVLSGVEEAPADWPLQVCSGIRALLAFLAANPAVANLLLVEGLRIGLDAHRQFTDAVRDLVPYVREGWQPAAADSPPPEEVDEAVIGGIVSLLARRIRAGEAAALEELFPEIAEFALVPYLGPGGARRIISAA